MKKNILIVIALILGGFFSSCDKYVDIQPKGQVIPRTANDLRLVLNNSIALAGSSSHIWYMDDDLVIPSQRFSYIQTNALLKTIVPVYGLEDEFYGEEEFDMDWYYNYESIATANYVLDNLDLVTGTQTQLIEIEAEAKLQRAFHYWQLVSQYGRHYGAGDPNEAETGVPLVKQFANVQASLQRASIQEVYDLIIEDLIFAVENSAEDIRTFVFQGSKWSAYGILSRVYLHMGQYQMALDYASDALGIKNDLMHYPTELSNYANTLGSPERDAGADVEIMLHKQGTVPYRYAYVPGVGFGVSQYLYLTDELIALYDQTNDTRFRDLTSVDASAGRARIYKGWTKMSMSAENGLSISEVLLIRAECYARLNNPDAAMDDVNYLRANRIDSSDPLIVELSATSSAEALQKVLEEKRRELAFRGVRYFDIKRLNALENAGIGLTRNNFDGVEVTLPANHVKWAMPIPVREMLINPEIMPNPRN